MPSDPNQTATYLRSLNTSDRARASAFDAVHNADDATAQRLLEQLPFSDDVRADLWDLRAGGTVEGASTPTPATAEQFTEQPPGVEGSAVRRFASNLGAMVNPVSIAKGLYTAVRHPVDTASAIGQGMAGQYTQAQQATSPIEKAGRYAASMIPVVGPASAAVGDQIATGDVAGGLGSGAGLLVPTLIPTAVKAAQKVARAVPTSVATRMDSAAAARVADVISPKVGPNKTRFGNQAERIAPALVKDLAAEGAPLTREGFHASIATKLSEAEQALDAAIAARNAKLVYHTKPIIAGLRAKADALTAQTVRSGRVTAGSNVVPGPNAARVAPIQRAIAELQELGPVASFESIRRIRQAYDGPAKAVYSPAMTADYMKAQGGKLGAADVTGVLRDKLAAMDPATAAANANYSLYKTADEVMQAIAEVERTRPKVGRAIVARLTGTMGGGATAGGAGAVAGFVFAPIVESALSQGITTKLKTAALLSKMATAVRGGNVTYANSLASQARRLGTTASAVIGGGATSPTESQTGRAPAMSTP